MLEYRVSYYLGDMYHSYIVDAENEYEATMRVLRTIPEGSQKIFRELKVYRASREWN